MQDAQTSEKPCRSTCWNDLELVSKPSKNVQSWSTMFSLRFLSKNLTPRLDLQQLQRTFQASKFLLEHKRKISYSILPTISPQRIPELTSSTGNCRRVGCPQDVHSILRREFLAQLVCKLPTEKQTCHQSFVRPTGHFHHHALQAMAAFLMALYRIYVPLRLGAQIGSPVTGFLLTQAGALPGPPRLSWFCNHKIKSRKERLTKQETWAKKMKIQPLQNHTSIPTSAAAFVSGVLYKIRNMPTYSYKSDSKT